MKEKGKVIPAPRKENTVNIAETPGAGISFCVGVQENEYITSAEAAKMLGLSKERTETLIAQRGIRKHFEVESKYLLLKSDIEKVRHGIN